MEQIKQLPAKAGLNCTAVRSEMNDGFFLEGIHLGNDQSQ
jgi:hypothetical protein